MLQTKKSFTSKKEQEKRIQHINAMEGAVPRITQITEDSIYSEFFPGHDLTYYCDVEILKSFFIWSLENLWKEVDYRILPEESFFNYCKRRYIDRTIEVLAEIYGDQTIGKINNIEIPNVGIISEILEKRDWKFGEPVIIHGDLHLANIIFNKNLNTFKVIDVDENYFGEADYGDKYYDIAKLYFSIVMPFNLVRNHEFTIEQNKSTTVVNVNYNKTLVNSYHDILKISNLSFIDVILIASSLMVQRSQLHNSPVKEFMLHYGLLNLADCLK
ncbi:MAG: phosphotransferase [Bacteroidetes bacterium]|nr:phosphotransferase [Bacteroidota bacterium]